MKSLGMRLRARALQCKYLAKISPLERAKAHGRLGKHASFNGATRRCAASPHHVMGGGMDSKWEMLFSF